MTNMTIHDIAVAEIEVPENRARVFSAEGAEALAAIIAVQGLQHPVRLRREGDRLLLVSGLHRLEAARRLGWATIPAVLSSAETADAARLEEVMENLGRNELVALDRCHHLYELKQVWERMYPQAKHGGDRKTEIATVVDALIEEIRRATANGQTVSLSGLGKFEQRQRPARMGRNPRTGEAVEIAASVSLAFKPSKAAR